MVSGLLLLILVGALVVLAIRKANARDGAERPDGHAVRRFFQYLLLYGLFVVVGVGLSGLLGRLLERDVLLAADEAALARDLAFTVVGVPLFTGVALWSRRRLAADAREARSLGWAFYVTAASLTSLVLAMTGLAQVLEWAMGLNDYSGRGLAGFVVWGALWGAHWWLDARVTPRENSRVHHVAGSLIGLVTAATGLAGLLAAALRSLLDLNQPVLAGQGSPVLQGLVTLVVGAPVWSVYWARTTARNERDPLWFAYVLLAGVGGGLVTAIASASTLAYLVLVWLVGEPRSTDAAQHFENAPTAAAAAAVGVLVWWYHEAVLKEAGAEERTEVRRVYEYLMAGIGLAAAAGGLTTLVVALIEAVVTGPGRVVVGASTVNTLLAAATLLAVGGPVWWVYWRRVQRAARTAPAVELLSTTRRVYLFVLFGVGGVAAVIALLVGMYLLFEDVVDGTAGAETLRRMRFSIGVLLTTAAIAAYHWAVFRSDREQVPEAATAHGPKFVLLVGPADPEIAREVAHRSHARVQAWSRADDGLAPWSADEVMAALGDTTSDEVIVLSEAGGLRTIPVRRR